MIVVKARPVVAAGRLYPPRFPRDRQHLDISETPQPAEKRGFPRMIELADNTKAQKEEAMSKLASMLLVVALVFVGCASPGRAVAKLEPGMTKQQILDILGSPADRSLRGSDEAWQYQEIAGFGQCKYTTVWIRDGKLVGITTRRGGSVAGCGLGSREVDWSQMPSGDGKHG